MFRRCHVHHEVRKGLSVDREVSVQLRGNLKKFLRSVHRSIVQEELEASRHQYSFPTFLDFGENKIANYLATHQRQSEVFKMVN